MAPVVAALKRERLVDVLLVSTGQHREILLNSLAAFNLEPDIDLGIMTQGQTLAQITSRAIEGLDAMFAQHDPQMVVAQGDTSTTFVAALAAFYRRIPFAHVEAGLRTSAIDNPFPEEFNRRAAGLVATLHFAPTKWAAENLRREGKPEENIFVTGNTGIDAVLEVSARTPQTWFPDLDRRLILLTTHRRENWGEPQRQISRAAEEIIEANPDTELVVAMHPNPSVRSTLMDILDDVPRVRLIEPPDYPQFVKLMERSTLILSDSGGVQEEAPAFGKPVLVLRDTTERPEGVTAGTALLVGTKRARIVEEANRLLQSPEEYRKVAQAVSPYGDGKAAERIRYVILRALGIDSPAEAMWS